MMKIQLTIVALALFLGGCASGKIKSSLNRSEQAGQSSETKKEKIKITPPPFLNEKWGLQGDIRRVDTVHIGDMAPDFKLKTMDGKRTVNLGQFNGKRPVVLIFGSYT